MQAVLQKSITPEVVAGHGLTEREHADDDLLDLPLEGIDRGVLLAPGDGCGDAYATWARLCYTAVPEPRLREGLARLAATIRDHR